MPYKDPVARRAFARAWQKKYNKEYRAKNRERLLAQDRLKYRRNEESLFYGTIRRKYGFTKQEWLGLYERQRGACAICLSPSKRRRLDIDHDHKTGLIRGLLCHSCNISLGRFNDDPQRCEAAARYLRGPATEA